ncbi:DUF1211 domain-containing protein [Nocardioides sp. cx-169]|uniref:TMEM175 family protein n=1 Tax=Nocardioides sp. cx-169 TaxID=2899080 RepID=UPI001E4C7C6C|nr:TMEM175 family protein [Nocardioides sp. cx-169]MCD4534275.1 DUF1211 domain-containing protein [Nocardioides sp. cx-169]
MTVEAQQNRSLPARAHYGTERMSALSDGVFAIVLTLLVLELKLPERDESIVALLADDWHVFLAWLISFLAIARFWLVHHSITADLRQCHNGTLALNFSVLGAVTLVPFSADIIGTERVAEPWSTVVFAVNIGVLSVAVGLLARHATREAQLLHPDHAAELLARSRIHHLYLLPAVTLVAAALAFVAPYASVGLLLAEFVAFGWLGGRRR